ncbi:Twin-arginine translocation protein TatA [Methanosarcina lacustris Z-7289]|uniref:Twin-arginine translocation protein TatA n=1 Tax=Methanosarcina lacustris Z-7289 TaxID=1434111 RepID=A0A0E3S631_9EURY|nr:twin-arginine translocase TatA/TatE family subunit [Methanosarcina lacustris]AKB74687.1 Twin-arginine translocation protein TatA [Methanosarcina lacustris Z-7289]
MIGSTELFAIAIAALFLFGPQKLPELARSLGSAVGEFKKAQRAAELELTEFDAYTRKAENKAREKEEGKEKTKVSSKEEGKEIKDSEDNKKEGKTNPLNAMECRSSIPNPEKIPDNQNMAMK